MTDEDCLEVYCRAWPRSNAGIQTNLNQCSHDEGTERKGSGEKGTSRPMITARTPIMIVDAPVPFPLSYKRNITAKKGNGERRTLTGKFAVSIVCRPCALFFGGFSHSSEYFRWAAGLREEHWLKWDVQFESQK